GGMHWREAMWVAAGAAAAGLLLLSLLVGWGALDAFIATIRGVMPFYVAMGSRSISEIFRDTIVWLAPVGGLALAAALSISTPKPPRVRALVGLTLFGLIHLLVQRKGWFYHVYPLGIGL